MANQQLAQSLLATQQRYASLQNQIKATGQALFSWHGLARLFAAQMIHTGIGSMLTELRASVKEAVKLQNAISEVMTISENKSQGQRDTYLTDVRRISEKFGQDATDVTEGLYQTISNQIGQGQVAINFLESASKLAMAAVGTTEDAVNSASSVMKSFQMDLGQTDDVAAKLFQTVYLGRLRLKDLGDLGQVGLISRQANVSVSEMLASLAQLTTAGMSPSTAMTQLRNVIQRLISPSKEMKILFKEMGVASGQDLIKMVGWGGVMEAMAGYTEGSATSLSKLITNMRGLALATEQTSTGGLKTYYEYLNKINNSTGDYMAAIEERLNSMPVKFEQMTQRIKNMFTIDMGGPLATTMVELDSHIGGIDAWIKGIGISLATVLLPSLIKIVKTTITWGAAGNSIMTSFMPRAINGMFALTAGTKAFNVALAAGATQQAAMIARFGAMRAALAAPALFSMGALAAGLGIYAVASTILRRMEEKRVAEFKVHVDAMNQAAMIGVSKIMVGSEKSMALFDKYLLSLKAASNKEMTKIIEAHTKDLAEYTKLQAVYYSDMKDMSDKAISESGKNIERLKKGIADIDQAILNLGFNEDNTKLKIQMDNAPLDEQFRYIQEHIAKLKVKMRDALGAGDISEVSRISNALMEDTRKLGDIQNTNDERKKTNADDIKALELQIQGLKSAGTDTAKNELPDLEKKLAKMRAVNLPAFDAEKALATLAQENLKILNDLRLKGIEDARIANEKDFKLRQDQETLIAAQRNMLAFKFKTLMAITDKDEFKAQSDARLQDLQDYIAAAKALGYDEKVKNTEKLMGAESPVYAATYTNMGVQEELTKKQTAAAEGYAIIDKAKQAATKAAADWTNQNQAILEWLRQATVSISSDLSIKDRYEIMRQAGIDPNSFNAGEQLTGEVKRLIDNMIEKDTVDTNPPAWFKNNIEKLIIGTTFFGASEPSILGPRAPGTLSQYDKGSEGTFAELGKMKEAKDTTESYYNQVEKSMNKGVAEPLIKQMELDAKAAAAEAETAVQAMNRINTTLGGKNPETPGEAKAKAEATEKAKIDAEAAKAKADVEEKRANIRANNKQSFKINGVEIQFEEGKKDPSGGTMQMNGKKVGIGDAGKSAAEQARLDAQKNAPPQSVSIDATIAKVNEAAAAQAAKQAAYEANLYGEIIKQVTLGVSDVIRKEQMTSTISINKSIIEAWFAAQRSVTPTTQIVNGLPVPQVKASGGMMHGSDSVSALLTAGEFVVSKQASRRYYNQLVGMNSGGAVTANHSSNVNVGDVNIALNSSGGVATDVQKIGHALRREIRRGTVRLT
jgi:TP901 family phage tail tape measure protein